MMHHDKTDHEHQLDQVLIALEADQDNVALLALKKDLEHVINLSRELAPKKRPTTSNIQRTKRDSNQDQNLDSPLQTEENAPLDAISLKIGDKCQVRSEGGGWLDATISSLNADRTRWVVITIKANETRAVSSKDIRPMPEHRAAPILQLLPLDGPQFATSATTVSSSNQPPTQKEKERRMKKVAARQEYIARKEAEHEEKATAWTSFQSKLARKTNTSLFKSALKR